MLITLVKKHIIHETQSESCSSVTFNSLDDALKSFYQYMSNYIADTTVEKFDITILNGGLIPVKTEHYERYYEPEPEPEVEDPNPEWDAHVPGENNA